MAVGLEFKGHVEPIKYERDGTTDAWMTNNNVKDTQYDSWLVG